MTIRNAGSLRATDLWTSHVDAKTLIEIGQERLAPCVSMFQPIAGAVDGSDARALGGLIARAGELLKAASISARQAAAILHPALSVVDAPQVWRSGSNGIAVFVSPEMFAVVLTGTQVSVQVVVARRFVTRQLLPALEDLTDFEVRSVLASLAAASPDGRVVIETEVVVPAAVRGLVAELYVDRCAEVWGRYDPTASIVTPMTGMGPDADDLIDLAAVRTLAHSGRVHVTDRLEAGGARTPMFAVLARAPQAPAARQAGSTKQDRPAGRLR
ncbi:MAG: hypothetical protein HYY34_00540 [Chloroflexi bacterium]|nr:hypothetical protein [Chloroflexota bacterium]